jgi:cytochrome c-type biogenesis protein CcmH/NrfG
VEKNPREFGALVNLGHMYAREGRPAEAVQSYRAALQVKSDLPGAIDSLAWLLATCPDGSVRDPAEALRLAAAGDRLAQGKNPRVLETLAAAQAANGDFAAAVATQTRALELLRAAADDRRRTDAESRLDSYRRNEPWVARP